MKISYNWLKEFVDIKVTPKKLACDLSLFGHEVEEIKKTGNDFILDFEITPNRGDCLSVYGMAREIAALYNLKIKSNITELPKEENIKRAININIKNKNTAKRFSAVIVENINITESPKWIKDRLLALGIRPINNIVDITNYIMMELGQPMHAFDYEKIAGGNFIIRNAKSGESVVTLDGKKRNLDKHAIVIENGKKIFDLAEIMGGVNSQIDGKTKTIVLEAAIFNPVMIRRTCKSLNLQTDASYRFERGVDPYGTIYAIQKAISLIYSLNSKIIIGKITDVKSENITLNKIPINIEKVNNLLGSKLTLNETTKLLAKLNFEVNNNVVTVPSYRTADTTLWQDIAEEIARIYGYNKLGLKNISSEKSKVNLRFNYKEYFKDVLAENGFTEIYSYSFSDKKLLVNLGYKLSDIEKVVNGLSPETEYLRPNLLPLLLSAIRKNPWAPEVKIFEIGKVFSKNKEKWQLGIAVTSKKGNEIIDIIKKLNINGEVKKVDQSILDYLKIRRPVYYFTMDFADIKMQNKKYLDVFEPTYFHDISEFPPTIRDLAFIADKNADALEIKNNILKIDKSILIVELFDEFISDKFGKNKKNIAYHVWLEDLNKPMTEKDVNNITDKIIMYLKNNYRANLRS